MKKTLGEKLRTFIYETSNRIFVLDKQMKDSIIDEDFTKASEIQTRIHELSMVLDTMKKLIK